MNGELLMHIDTHCPCDFPRPSLIAKGFGEFGDDPPPSSHTTDAATTVAPNGESPRPAASDPGQLVPWRQDLTPDSKGQQVQVARSHKSSSNEWSYPKW